MSNSLNFISKVERSDLTISFTSAFTQLIYIRLNNLVAEQTVPPTDNINRFKNNFVRYQQQPGDGYGVFFFNLYGKDRTLYLFFNTHFDKHAEMQGHKINISIDGIDDDLTILKLITQGIGGLIIKGDDAKHVVENKAVHIKKAGTENLIEFESLKDLLIERKLMTKMGIPKSDWQNKVVNYNLKTKSLSIGDVKNHNTLHMYDLVQTKPEKKANKLYLNKPEWATHILTPVSGKGEKQFAYIDSKGVMHGGYQLEGEEFTHYYPPEFYTAEPISENAV